MELEYDQGTRFCELLSKGHFFSEAKLIRIFTPLLRGLKRIHDNGSVHKNISPSDIYIHRDIGPVLVGRAKVEQDNLPSEDYAPFERIDSGDETLQGPWTDIYSFGAILYQAISGKVPMSAMKRSLAIRANKKDPYESLLYNSNLQKRYSADLLEAVDAALRFNANERPQSVEAWLRLLEGRKTSSLKKHNHHKSKTKIAEKFGLSGGEGGDLFVADKNNPPRYANSNHFRSVAILGAVSLFFVVFSLIFLEREDLLMGFDRGESPATPSNDLSGLTAFNAELERQKRPDLLGYKAASDTKEMTEVEKIEEKLRQIENDKLSYSLLVLTRYNLLRQILELEPNHLSSLYALREIHNNLAKKALLALENSGPDKAREHLALLKKIDGSDLVVKKIESEISEKESPPELQVVKKKGKNQSGNLDVAKQSSKKDVKTTTKIVASKPVKASLKRKESPNIETALEKISRFNVALGSGDLKTIEGLALISLSNRSFLNMLFDEYNLSDTEISKVNHISSSNTVEVDIKITKLINKEGFIVEPSQKWSTIPVQAKFHEKLGWKIHW